MTAEVPMSTPKCSHKALDRHRMQVGPSTLHVSEVNEEMLQFGFQRMKGQKLQKKFKVQLMAFKVSPQKLSIDLK